MMFERLSAGVINLTVVDPVINAAPDRDRWMAVGRIVLIVVGLGLAAWLIDWFLHAR